MTMPGVPSVFAGDQLGLTGTNGEHARTPMPWDTGVWDTPTWDAYRTWVALRREHVALRRGGLRWVDVTADSLTYLREHTGERILVHVVRPSPGRSAAAAAPVTLEASLLGVQGARALVGEDLAVTGADVVLPTTVGAHVYQLDTAGWEWND